LQFRVQQGEAHEWKRVIDTGLDDRPEELMDSLNCSVGPRSIVVLVRESERGKI
jgi:hypothetical protein